jgi:high-affinity Fe2+/Pb2+ permease
MFAELPDWFDLGFLRGVTIGTAVALAIGVLACFVFIRKLALRLVLAGLLMALAGGLVFYRVHLDDCAKTCTCSLLGSSLDAKGCDIPGRIRN